MLKVRVNKCSRESLPGEVTTQALIALREAAVATLATVGAEGMVEEGIRPVEEVNQIYLSNKIHSYSRQSAGVFFYAG